jgi:hypothetical protein
MPSLESLSSLLVHRPSICEAELGNPWLGGQLGDASFLLVCESYYCMETHPIQSLDEPWQRKLCLIKLCLGAILLFSSLGLIEKRQKFSMTSSSRSF